MKAKHTILLVTSLLAFDARAALASQATEKPARAESTSESRFTWSGRTKSSDGTWRAAETRADDATVAHDLLRELARIELMIDVDRKLEEARRELDALRVRAASSAPYPGRRDVLVEIALLRAKVLGELGRKEDALGALERLLPGERERASVTLELVPADDAALTDEKAARENPRIGALRARLQPKAATVAASLRGLGYVGGGESIDDAVFRAYGDGGDPAIVEQIGARAVPALEKLVLANLDHFPATPERDPFVAFVRHGETRAAEVVLEKFDAGGFFWKKRILRAIEKLELFGVRGWKHYEPPGEAARLAVLHPAWVPVLERLLADFLVRHDALPLAREIAIRDGVTPGLAQALAEMLASDDPELVARTRERLANARGNESVRPIYERALASDDVEMRRWAAEQLTYYDSNAALLSAAEDKDPGVRAQVAVSLGKLEQTVLAFFSPSSVGVSARVFVPVLDDSGRALLRRLVRDPEASVRVAAVSAIVASSHDFLSREELEALARDESVEVRTKLTLLSLPDVSLLAAIKAIQASDPERAVVDALDGWLRSKCHERFNQGPSLDPYLDAFERRWLHPSYPLWDREIARTGADFVRAFLLDPEGMRRITRLAVERKDVELIRRIAFAVDWSGRREDKSRASMAPLDDELFEGLLRATFEALDVNGFRGVRQGLAKRVVPRDEMLLRILADRSASRRLRLAAGEATAETAGPAFEAGLLDVLADPSWKERGLEHEEEELLEQIARRIEAGARERVLVRALRAREAADEPMLRMLAFYPGLQLSEPLALAVLDRWPSVPEEHYQLFARAVAGVGPATPENVQRILEAFGAQKLALPAVKAMGRMRDPSFLEPLGRLLRSDVDDITPRRQLQVATPRRQLQVAAAHAIANYFSDEAAELLLAGATSTDEEVRKACFDALETIRRYQDEKGRWATRKSGESARASAVLEVVPLLDDRDPMIRAQAARSLATLDAVEQLPRLLALLKDGAPVVREAAQQAIDRLNAVQR